jgi:hypothetical protein
MARQFIHFDANFHLIREKHKQASGSDIALSDGKAFFVEDKPYRQYLESADASQQVGN